MGTILIRFSWPTLLVKSLVSQETLFRNNICTYPWSDKCKYILGEHFLLIFDYCGNYNSYPEFASYDQMQTIYPWFRFSYQCTSRKASLETDNLEFWYNSLVWQVQHTLYDNTSTFNHSPCKPNGVQSHNKSHPGHGASSVKIQSLFWNEIFYSIWSRRSHTQWQYDCQSPPQVPSHQLKHPIWRDEHAPSNLAVWFWTLEGVYEAAKMCVDQNW